MKIGRNHPCPCGSGKKFKQCCAGRPHALPQSGRPVDLPTKVPGREPEPVRQRRDCDGCTACCGPALLINDPDLVSPSGESCPNLRGNRCSIHGESMPATCKSYMCNYLVEPGPITVNERPDRVGAIVRLALDRRLKPPLNQVTHLNECAPGGLMNVLKNRVWGWTVRRDLRMGRAILISRIDDPYRREAIHVRFFEGKLACELTSCHADGSPVLEPRQPVYERPLHAALIIPNQRFAFDAEVFVRQLGDRDFMVIGPSTSSAVTTDLRFLFTRRQAELLEALGGLCAKETALPGTGASAMSSTRSHNR